MAHHAAQTLAADLGGLVQRLDRSARWFEWARLDAEDDPVRARTSSTRQDQRVIMALLFDGQGGLLAGMDESRFEPSRQHRVGPDDARAFAGRVPFQRARAEGHDAIVLSPVYPDADAGGRDWPSPCRASSARDATAWSPSRSTSAISAPGSCGARSARE